MLASGMPSRLVRFESSQVAVYYDRAKADRENSLTYAPTVKHRSMTAHLTPLGTIVAAWPKCIRGRVAQTGMALHSAVDGDSKGMQVMTPEGPFRTFPGEHRLRLG